VVLESGQCSVFYGDLMDDGSVIAKGRDKRYGVDADVPGKGKVDKFFLMLMLNAWSSSSRRGNRRTMLLTSTGTLMTCPRIP
jgi:hypothetical protein